MSGIEQVRRHAMALPEAEEGTHFRLPSFKVAGKGFVGTQNGDTHAIASVGRDEAEALADEAPDVFEVVWRTGGIFVGVRIELAAVSDDRLAEVIGHAWRHRAPRRLVAAHPEAGDPLPSGLGRPATRALDDAGHTSLHDLTTVSEHEVASLHGVGPAAMRRLRDALARTERTFADA